MNPFQRIRGATVALFKQGAPSARPRLPSPPRPTGDGVAPIGGDQTRAGGLVSDFAIDRFATALSRVPDPDDVLRRAGMQRHDLRRLEFDDEISGALETRREAAITTAWILKDEDADDGEASEHIEFVTKELSAVFDTMMRGLWQAVPYGYSVTEAIYAQRDDGRIGINRMAVKPMQWFEPLRDGRLIYVRPGDGVRTELDQRQKFLMLTRGATYANPYGEALLSRLYWCWFFRHTGWKSWMQFVERFGDPFVVGKSDRPQELVEALLGMGVKNVIGVGSEDEINVLLQSGDSTFDRLDARLTERILKTILGQTLTSGTGKDGSGSRALGVVHDQVRQDKRIADTRLLQTGGQWLVNALWNLNRFPGVPPKFEFEKPHDIQAERATRDATLVNAGIVEFEADYIERAYGFEKGDFTVPEGGGEGVAPTAAPAAPGGPGVKAPNQRRPGGKEPKPGAKLGEGEGGDDEHTPRSRGRRGMTPAQRVVEGLGDATMLHAPESALSAADLRAAILGAADRDDLEERIAALIDRQDPKFAASLERAIFAADVLGYIHSEEGD